jgi:hypothetical protein
MCGLSQPQVVDIFLEPPLQDGAVKFAWKGCMIFQAARRDMTWCMPRGQTSAVAPIHGEYETGSLGMRLDYSMPRRHWCYNMTMSHIPRTSPGHSTSEDNHCLLFGGHMRSRPPGKRDDHLPHPAHRVLLEARISLRSTKPGCLRIWRYHGVCDTIFTVNMAPTSGVFYPPHPKHWMTASTTWTTSGAKTKAPSSLQHLCGALALCR